MTSMGLVAPVTLFTGLVLEVFALRNHDHVPLKAAATAASIAYLAMFVVYRPPGPFTRIWPLGMNIYCLAQRCWNHLWLKKSHAFRRKAAKAAHARSGEEQAAGQTPRLSLLDALDVAVAFRGVGWSFEVRGIPASQPSPTSRLDFASGLLQGALLRFLALDAAITYADSSYSNVTTASLPVQLALGGLMIIYIRWTMDIPYRVVSAIAVLSGISAPSAWPPLFGAWRDAYTIRRFWSHTWHQGMRLLAEPAMDFVAHSLLRLPRVSYASKWARLFGNFGIACLDHAYGRFIAGGDPTHDLKFFLVQPIAIWVEETVREFFVARGCLSADRKSRSEQWLGYAWTAVFQCCAFLYFNEGIIRVKGKLPSRTLIEPAFGLHFGSSLC